MKNDTEKEVVKHGFLVIFPSLEFFCKKSFNETKSNVIFLSFFFGKESGTAGTSFFFTWPIKFASFFLFLACFMILLLSAWNEYEY